MVSAFIVERIRSNEKTNLMNARTFAKNISGEREGGTRSHMYFTTVSTMSTPKTVNRPNTLPVRIIAPSARCCGHENRPAAAPFSPRRFRGRKGIVFGNWLGRAEHGNTAIPFRVKIMSTQRHKFINLNCGIKGNWSDAGGSLIFPHLNCARRKSNLHYEANFYFVVTTTRTE